MTISTVSAFLAGDAAAAAPRRYFDPFKPVRRGPAALDELALRKIAENPSLNEELRQRAADRWTPVQRLAYGFHTRQWNRVQLEPAGPARTPAVVEWCVDWLRLDLWPLVDPRNPLELVEVFPDPDAAEASARHALHLPRPVKGAPRSRLAVLPRTRVSLATVAFWLEPDAGEGGGDAEAEGSEPP